MKKLKRIKYLLLFLLSISLAANAQYSMKVGYTQYLSITPPKGTVRNSTWQCDEGLMLTDRSEVGAIVKITHYFSGSAYVHCQYSYEYLGTYDKNWHAGTATQTYRITCIAGSASISKTSLELNPGGSYKLSCTKSDSYGTPTWESSNEDVATVDKNGKVTALQSGYARITLDPIVAAPLFCDVTVKAIPPTSVSLIPNSLSIDNGASGNLVATLYPKGATAKLSWISSNEQIATVNTNGTVTGHKAGNAVIAVKTDNGLSATANVIVNKTKVKLTCSALGDEIVTKGTTVKLNADAENARIYYTLNGGTPTRYSSVYTGPITLNNSCTLKALACADGYLDSDILTQNFKVTSLMVQNAYPANGAADVQYYTIPSVEFNGDIKKGRNFDKIMLESELSSGNETLEKKCHVFRDKIFIEPLRYLAKGGYKITVPQGAVVNGKGEENVSFTCSFSTLDTYIKRFVNYLGILGTTTYAIKNDDSVWGCGYNNLVGLFGTNYYKKQNKLIRCSFYNLKKVQTTSYGSHANYLFLQGDGKLLAKGDNYETSHFVELLADVKDAKFGSKHVLALKNDGSLWTWGDNSDGLLGMETENKVEIYPLKLMDGVKKIFLNSETSYVIKEDNSLWAWGNNNNGSVGYVQTAFVKTPLNILNDIDSIACYDNHVFAITRDGTLFGWGENRSGTLGIGSDYNSYVPKIILHNVRKVSTNRLTSYAITQGNVLYTWGYNEYGSIGAGETDKYVYSPTKVLTDVDRVISDRYSCAALKTDGTLWKCGRNNSGGNGDGTVTVSKKFKKVADNVRDFNSDATNLFVLKVDNSLWGCGNNTYGQLGDGTTKQCSSLKRIAENVQNFTGISSIRAMKTDGSIWTWGYNKEGILGIGEYTESITSPVMLQAPAKELLGFSTAHVKEMIVGECQAVTLDIYPEDANIKELVWESDNPEVLSVNSKGILEAKKAGSAKYTVYIKTDSGMIFDSEGNVVVKSSVTGIKMLEEADTQISISIDSGNLIITSTTQCDICLYGMDGRLLFKKCDTKAAFLGKLARGGYIVKAGGRTKKFVMP